MDKREYPVDRSNLLDDVLVAIATIILLSTLGVAFVIGLTVTFDAGLDSFFKTFVR
jgi:hypothetical protein